LSRDIEFACQEKCRQEEEEFRARGIPRHANDIGQQLSMTDPTNGHTTTYTYNDPLNRLTTKSYNDNPQTPTANFFYNQAPSSWPAWSGVTFSNPKGRMVLTCTGTAANTCTSPPQTATAHSYDTMGRTNNYWQCNPSNCGSSSIWQSTYQYNLTGDVTQWTHPAPPNYTYTNTISASRHFDPKLPGGPIPSAVLGLQH
jgi:hypothetical protein